MAPSAGCLSSLVSHSLQFEKHRTGIPPLIHLEITVGRIIGLE